MVGIYEDTSNCGFRAFEGIEGVLITPHRSTLGPMMIVVLMASDTLFGVYFRRVGRTFRAVHFQIMSAASFRL